MRARRTPERITGTAVVKKMLTQSWNGVHEGRWEHALTAAGRAVEGAKALDDPGLLVAALLAESRALNFLGDHRTALIRCMQVLTLAEKPATRHQLTDDENARRVFQAYYSWADTARSLVEVPCQDILAVLATGEKWLAATGRHEWKSSLLLDRALVYKMQGEFDKAVVEAEKALAAFRPEVPGFCRDSHRRALAGCLIAAGRPAQAASQCQTVLDNPDGCENCRMDAYDDLARCALEAGEPAEALRYATTAVALAEPLGNFVLSPPLGTLATIYHSGGDLDTAWATATRSVDAACRAAVPSLRHRSGLIAVDIALDRADLHAIRQLLTQLDPDAKALDRAAEVTFHSAAVRERRDRFEALIAVRRP